MVCCSALFTNASADFVLDWHGERTQVPSEGLSYRAGVTERLKVYIDVGTGLNAPGVIDCGFVQVILSRRTYMRVHQSHITIKYANQ